MEKYGWISNAPFTLLFFPSLPLSVRMCHMRGMGGYMRAGLVKNTELCKKKTLTSFENQPQNVPLPTLKLHNGSIFQLAIPKTWQECFYTALYIPDEGSLRRKKRRKEGCRIYSAIDQYFMFFEPLLVLASLSPSLSPSWPFLDVELCYVYSLGKKV